MAARASSGSACKVRVPEVASYYHSGYLLAQIHGEFSLRYGLPFAPSHASVMRGPLAFSRSIHSRM
jgi:hypothetical protein